MATLICPRCQVTYPDGRTKCPRHLVTLIPLTDADPVPDVAGLPDPIRVSPTAADVRCPAQECGASSPAGSVECEYCGSRLVHGGPCLIGPWGELHLDDTGPVQLGRQSAAARVAESLRDLDAVSRFHAEVVVRDGEAWISDVGSLNGTFVNDRRLDRGAPVVLQPGDRIRLGSAVHVEYGEPRG